MATVLAVVALLCLAVNGWLALRRRKKRQQFYIIEDDSDLSGSINQALQNNSNYDSVSERGSFVLAG